MKKYLFKQGLVTLTLFVSLAIASASAEEVKKEYHRDMVPTDNTTLTIKNKFGEVVTQTWESNSIVIDVIVKVEHQNAEKAEKLLSMIDVRFTESNGSLTAETIFDEDFSSVSWKGNENHFSIDYAVKMPANINLSVVNKYGNVNVDKVDGLANLDVKYGNLTVFRLTRGNVKPLNAISVSYGKADIDEVSWAEIYSRYCGHFDVGTAMALSVDSRYSKIYIDKASSVVCDSKYDGITIDEAKNIVITSGYSGLSFGTVYKKLEVETKYGNLSVEKIPAGFEAVSVKAGYCSVQLGIDPSACYNLSAKSAYGSIKMNDENFDVNRRIIGNTSSEISGTAGSCTSPKSTVDVSASYGSVKLY